MTAVTFPLRLPRLAFAICGWRWQNDMHEIKYSVSYSTQQLDGRLFDTKKISRLWPKDI